MGLPEKCSLNEEERLVLYSIGALNNTPLTGKTKLQKLLFLLSNVFRNFHDLLEFEPHLLGPYSETVDYILEDLIQLGLIDKNNNCYKLTDLGLEMYHQLKPKRELMDVIEDFKGFLNDLPENELLAFIYVSYPKYISESAVWDKLKLDRLRISISLLKKHKLSFSKAAEIAGLNIIDFEKFLRNKNIRWRE